MRWKPPFWGSQVASGTVWNALAALSGKVVPIDQGGTTIVLALVDPPPAGSWIVTAKSTAFGIPVAVMVTRFPFREMFDSDLDIPDLSTLPENLRRGILEGVFAVLASTVPGSFELEALGDLSSMPAFTDPDVQWFAIRLQSDAAPEIEFAVGASRTRVIGVLANRLAEPTPASPSWLHEVMVNADISAGSLTLTCGELRSIRPGAIVVMPKIPAHVALVHIQAWEFEFLRTDRGLVCEAIRQRAAKTRHSGYRQATKGTDVDDETVDGSEKPEHEVISLEDLHITLDFDLGRKLVPLGALAEWRVGSVVDFEPPVVGDGVEVSIRANGDLVGIGDLVRIDDRLAVRITRFLLSNSMAAAQ